MNIHFIAVIGLSILITILALIAAGIGLFLRGTGAPYSFTTLRGEQAQIYGQGIYRYDTVFTGAGYKGQDAVVFFLGIPLLLLTTFLYIQGTIGGALLMAGVLGYFLYIYASMALGAAYNRLFLLYVVLFSASLHAFILVFSSVNLEVLAAHLSVQVPRLALAIFMVVSGLVTLVAWGAPLVSALLKGGPPTRMDSYTTSVTYALDLAIITPAAFLSGALILLGFPLGYLIAFPLLVLIILLAPQIILSTVFQRSAGVPFTPGEMIGPVAGFTILGLVAIVLLFLLGRGIFGFI